MVYEAENAWTGRTVAVKILRSDLTRSPEVAQRFLREGRAAARFSHPNVVDVLDMGEDPDDGALYIVMELLRGEDLRTMLDRHRKLTPAEVLPLITPVMEALGSLHAQGVVHRDVKPSNVFLSRDHRGALVPKLIDFGMARLLDPANLEFRTRTGQMIGTPRYMAPEQVRGDRDLDARADVWSVGVVLDELLAGVPPFDAPSVPEVLTQIRTSNPPPLALSSLGVPLELNAVVHRALSPDRERRFASMELFLTALRDAIPEAHPTARVSPIPEVPRIRPRDPAVFRRVAVGLGCALVAVATAGAWRISQPPPAYTFHVQASPSTADVLLDGAVVGHGALHYALPRDGRAHTLRVSASGYTPRTVTFCDTPPPPVVVLTPARR